MKSLFDAWKVKIPNYSSNHKELFDSLSKKGGAEGDKKLSLGKHFSNNYELYIFAFFLGLSEDELTPIQKDEKKINFSHHIQYWGSKRNHSSFGRKDFSKLQKYMFIALVSKTDIDVIALDKGELEENDVVSQLIVTMESYTNGGLNLIRDKVSDNPNYFLNSTSFLDMMLK